MLALLPSYLEREGSSLIEMAEGFIRQSGHAESGFYLYQHRELYDKLNRLADRGERFLLLGCRLPCWISWKNTACNCPRRPS